MGTKRSIFGSFPLCEDAETGASFGQSQAILNYVIKKYNIGGIGTMKDYAVSCQMGAQSYDWHTQLGGAHYAPDRTVAMDKLFAAGGSLHTNLGRLEAVIDPTTGFFGSVMMPGDTCIVAYLDMLDILEPGVLKAYPGLTKLHATVFAHKDCAALKASTPYDYFKRKSDAK